MRCTAHPHEVAPQGALALAVLVVAVKASKLLIILLILIMLMILLILFIIQFECSDQAVDVDRPKRPRIHPERR